MLLLSQHIDRNLAEEMEMKVTKSLPESKFDPCYRGKGAARVVTGYLEVFRVGGTTKYVSIPGASRWMDLNGNVRAI